MKLFKRKPKEYTIDQKYKIIEAFKLNGKRYMQFATATDMPAGRGLSAMVIYEEFRSKADKEYLELHCRATEAILNPKPGQSIKLGKLTEINNNLRERINLVALPDHCYKLASVHFFDESESPYYYDIDYNSKKIEEWKKNPAVLSFFLSGPLKAYLPFLDTQSSDAQTFLSIAQKIGDMHQSALQDLLSKKE